MINVVAEIGINHNGSLAAAKKLIDVAVNAGCNFVKFQKRDPNLIPTHMKSKIRETPWGEMTYLEYKQMLEFDEHQFTSINQYSKIPWFCSVWDHPSVDFMSEITTFGKIPSAKLTDSELCRYARKKFDFLILSTGMSTEEEIENAIRMCKPDVVMHTVSDYPTSTPDLHLSYMHRLKTKVYGKSFGYSSHDLFDPAVYAAIGMGATWIEKHITLSENAWGSDHKASYTEPELVELVTNIRHLEQALGPDGPREIFEVEREKRESLKENHA